MKRLHGLLLGIGLLLVLATTAMAQESRYGVGVFFDRSVPMMGFNDRYTPSQIYGVVFDYRLSNRTTMEFEYHHMTMEDGKIEDQAFIWPIDKKSYLSPDAQSRFNLNSFVINALAHLRQRTNSDEMQLLPYIAVGAGYYDYQDRVSGLIFPGQKIEPLDPTIQQDYEDEHTALGANFGLGMAIVQGRFGLDVRGRYNVILGDLRPLEAWGFSGVFPITTMDFRTTFKLYW
ncbi:MAG: hypothetical protein ACO36I_04010 [Candidatus Latescibacterota bacterium]|jgi:hypothetical protein